MQSISSIRRFLININKNKIRINLNNIKNNYFTTVNFESKFSVPEIERIGKEFKNNRDRIQSSIKPKTLNEIKKIQNFVKTTNAQNDLEEVLYRNTKKNQEFNQFFSEFKQKNDGKWKSIINGMDLDEDTLRQETKLDKADELEMLKEFEKRRKFKATLDIINHKESQETADKPDRQVEENLRTTAKKVYSNANSNPESIESALSPDNSQGEIFDASKFNLIFLDADMVCNMTRLNRVYERRCLLYIGNKEGLVAYGIGRGPLYEDAYIDAYKQLKKNLIAIPIDPLLTCSLDLKGRFNDYRIYIKSNFNPSFWGHHLMCLMLRYAGLYHVGFFAKSRKREPYAMIFAFFKAITKNKTPVQTSEIMAYKHNKQYVSRGRRYEYRLAPVVPK